MSLEKLDIHRVRNITHASISPTPGINFIYGNNASGKSALLEALFILGRSKSFRSSSVNQVIQFDQPDLIVSAKLKNQHSSVTSVGVQLGKKTKAIHINQKEIHLRSELAYAFPVQLIHPKSYLLLDGGPQLRREFMDWGVFNQHQEFLIVWQAFKKALAHRNALLKKQDVKQINVWNHELSQYGTIVAEYRHQYLTQLEPHLRIIVDQFIETSTPEIKYLSGWDAEKSYLECLQMDLDKDLRYGFTQSGPHRGDFVLYLQQRIAKDFVSRGQLKLLVLALKLAQIELSKATLPEKACLLIDDITSELDSKNRSKLLSLLAQLDHQVFITTNELNEFGKVMMNKQHKVFHVEHGEIKSI